MEKKSFNIFIFFFIIINYTLYSQEKIIKYEYYNNKKSQNSQMYIIFSKDTIMLSSIENNIFNNNILENNIKIFDENDTFDILIEGNENFKLLEDIPIHILKCDEIGINIKKVKNTKKLKRSDTFVTYCGSFGIAMFHKIIKKLP